MSTVLKKGAPSRSYPSRQRKLGPAPFASFEDLSDELDSPGVATGEESGKVTVMPEIQEDHFNERGQSEACQSPTMMMHGGEDTPSAVRAHRNVTATSSASTVTFAPSHSAPTSGPTSGLQTPSTPRIDISCASSSTPPSEESASEKELFPGGLGLAFHEDAVDDLRSSTEELDLGEEEISSEEERRRKRLEEQEMCDQEIYRRSSHPANIFSRKPSVPAAPPPPDDTQRKPSAHSLFLEGLLNRPCRHASFGHGDYMRPGAASSLSTYSAGSGQRSRSRSPSPHKLMFETSFCGSKPIPTKSMEASSPPKDKPCSALGSIPSPQVTENAATSIRRMSDDINLVGGTNIPSAIWQEQSAFESAAIGPKDMDIISRTKTPLSPQPSSLGFDSRRPSTGRRSVSPHNMLLETSFCGNRPIPTKSMEIESPPKDLSELGVTLAENENEFGVVSHVNAHCHKTVTTAQVHRHSSGDKNNIINKDVDHCNTHLQNYSLSNRATDVTDSSAQYTVGGRESISVPYLPGSPESPKSSDLWQPISPRLEIRPTFSPSSVSSQSKSHFASYHSNQEETSCLPSPQASSIETQPTCRWIDGSESQGHQENNKNTVQLSSSAPRSSTIMPKSNEISSVDITSQHKKSPEKFSKSSDKQNLRQSLEQDTRKKGVGFRYDKSESGDQGMEEEITTEMKISEDPTVTVEDVPIESKSLFFQYDSFEEEGELPYVPTTLPQEKLGSTIVPIMPVSERKKMALMLNTVPVQRPKVTRPANPASLNDYIAYSNVMLPKCGRGGVGTGGAGEDVDSQMKMKINLPREDSLGSSSSPKPKSPRKKVSTTWNDFANLGLRSPREIRKKLKEENGAMDDISSYHSDSSSNNETIGVADGAEETDTESLLKLPKVPFAMDLDVHSNRSSVISQDDVQKSPSECSALLGSPDDLDSKNPDSHD